MAFWDELTTGIIIVVAGGLILNYITSALTRAKSMNLSVRKLLFEKRCDICYGKGLVTCSECKGSGSVQKEAAVQGICKRCGGSGLIEATCIQCSGVGTITRQLRHAVVDSPTATYWTLIPWGWHQNVKVFLRNMDEKAGHFAVRVQLGDRMNQSKEDTKSIPAGDVGEFSFSFDIEGKEPYEVTYEVKPESPPFACPRCQGTKVTRNNCAVCGGTGRVSESKSILEKCPKCGGAKEVQCSRCGGTGRTKRL